VPRLAGAAPRSSCSSDAMQSLLASAPRPLAPPSWCRLPAPDEASRPSPRLRPLHPRLGGVGVGAGSTTCRAAGEAENAVAIPDAAVEVETVRRHFPARQPDGPGIEGRARPRPRRLAARSGQASRRRRVRGRHCPASLSRRSTESPLAATGGQSSVDLEQRDHPEPGDRLVICLFYTKSGIWTVRG